MADSSNNDRVSRRRFLQSIGIAGALGASGTLLTACGGGSDSGSDASSDGGSDASTSGTTASADCSDLSSLSASEKKNREQMVSSLQYVEETPNPEQKCSNCQLYVESEYGAGCGGCTLFPGPVAANGYCNSWAPAS